MKINRGQPQPEGQPSRGRIVVSMNPIREKVMLDIEGNEIDPRTKKIIKKADNK